MGKVLLFLACLIVPGVWGLIVQWGFARFLPPDWRKEPAFRENGKEADAPCPDDVWHYQI